MRCWERRPSLSVTATAAVGPVLAQGGRGAMALHAGQAVTMAVGTVRATGQRNLTDDEWIVLALSA